MIVLSVISFNGAAVDVAPVSFDELGGTIGRATTNQLVLPDPDRTISRVHAHIVFRSGKYSLIDRGGNAVLHNGVPVSNGREVPLAIGDEIKIGAYLISVSTGAAATGDDPFSGFDSAAAGLQSPAVSRNTGTKAPEVGSGFADVHSMDFGLPAQSTLHSQLGGGGIPEDWDPFKQDSAGDGFPGGLGGPPDHADPFSQLGQGKPGVAKFDSPVSSQSGDQSLDALFGLSGAAQGKDPLAGSSLMAPQFRPNTAGNVDPFRALQQAGSSVPNTVHDHDSDLNSPWLEIKPKIKTPMPEATGPQAVRSGQVTGGGADALVAAFLEGLGVPGLRLRQIDPDAMQQLGRLLREATKGTVELLAARTAMKKEVRAEVTVMSTVANNPLKFSPTADLALQYLLGPATPGFMGPAEAMSDAYDDLRAHQLGVMAGMRAALSGVLKRFDPAALEGKHAPNSSFASLIPSNRKAQLWDRFQDLFGELLNEAEDDFDELFGDAFVKEYERYVAQLNSSKR